MHGAVFGLVAGLAVGVGHVDRHAHRDVTGAGEAGLGAALVIAGDEALEIRDGHGARGDEQPEAHAADQRVRLLGGGRHPDRRVRLLVGLGHDADIVELEVAALVREALLRPRLAQDVEGLQKPIAALDVGDVEALIVRGQPAAADAEFQPALRQVIDGGHVFGQT